MALSAETRAAFLRFSSMPAPSDVPSSDLGMLVMKHRLALVLASYSGVTIGLTVPRRRDFGCVLWAWNHFHAGVGASGLRLAASYLATKAPTRILYLSQAAAPSVGLSTGRVSSRLRRI